MSLEVITIADLKRGAFVAEEDAPDDLAAIPRDFAEIARSNPLASERDPAAFALRGRDGEATARLRVLPGEIAVGPRRARVFWDMDLLSKPGHRSAGVGFFLVRSALKAIRASGGWFASFASTDEALALYERLKMHNLGDVPRYLWPLKAGPIVDAHLPPAVGGPAARLANALLDVGDRLVHRPLKQAADGYEIARVEHFDREIDGLVDDSVSAPDARRGWLPFDHRALNWRVRSIQVSDPEKRVTALYLRARDSGRLQGFALLRTVFVTEIPGHPYRDFRLTTMLDHWTVDDDRRLQAALLHAALDLARQQEADVLEVITTDGPLRRQLEAAYFRRVGGYSFTVAPPPDFDGDLPRSLFDWRLTMAAGDGFLF
jgi:GNAT superfamily N-acetyltransferase